MEWERQDAAGSSGGGAKIRFHGNRQARLGGMSVNGWLRWLGTSWKQRTSPRSSLVFFDLWPLNAANAPLTHKHTPEKTLHSHLWGPVVGAERSAAPLLFPQSRNLVVNESTGMQTLPALTALKSLRYVYQITAHSVLLHWLWRTLHPPLCSTSAPSFLYTFFSDTVSHFLTQLNAPLIAVDGWWV